MLFVIYTAGLKVSRIKTKLSLTQIMCEYCPVKQWTWLCHHRHADWTGAFPLRRPFRKICARPLGRARSSVSSKTQIWRSASSANRYGKFVFKCCEGYECEQAGWTPVAANIWKAYNRHMDAILMFSIVKKWKKKPNKQKPTTLQLVLFETSLFIPFSSVSKHLWWGHRFGKNNNNQHLKWWLINRNEKRNTSAVNDTT